MSALRRLLAAIGRLLLPRLDLRAATAAIQGPPAGPAPDLAPPPEPPAEPPTGPRPRPRGATAREPRATKVSPLPARFGRRPPRRTESEGWPRE